MDIEDRSSGQFGTSGPQFDPIKKLHTESPQIAASWLKHGENLNALQRIGHSAVSIAFLSAGTFAWEGVKANFKEANVVMGLMFCVAVLFFFLFGGMGLRNALRFKRGPSE